MSAFHPKALEYMLGPKADIINFYFALLTMLSELRTRPIPISSAHLS